MLDDWGGCITPDNDTAGHLLCRTHAPRRVNVLIRYGRQRRQITTDELARRIKALGLRDRIKNAEPRLCITARRRSPLPATVIRCQIEIIELLRKPRLTALPVNAEILGQERGHHHTQTIVHVAGVIQLVHCCINQRIASASAAPRGKMCIRLCALFPLDGIKLRLERALGDMREGIENHEIKITPDQLGKPGHGAFAVLFGIF